MKVTYESYCFDALHKGLEVERIVKINTGEKLQHFELRADERGKSFQGQGCETGS